jgi:hypothetical protein
LDATALFKACNPKPTALFKAHVALVKASHFLALAFAFWPPVTTSTQEVPSPSLFFSQWPCCIGCGKGLGPCLPPPLPLPSPAFVLALAPFTGAGPVGSSELSVVSFCSLLLLLLEELDSFSLGLDSFFLVPARSKKMMWEYLCSQDLIFFVTKLGFKKWQKTSSAEVLTPPHLGLLAVGPSSPAGLARQPNLACKTDPVVLDQNGQWCWIKMGLWSQQHHQWIFGCNRQNHLKQNKWA